MVTGTNTVSFVTFRKSVRHAKCTWSRTIRDVTSASKSLNFTAGACCTFANCSSRLNSFILAGCPPIVVGRFVPSDLVKRSAFDAIPIDSIKLKPAPGTCRSEEHTSELQSLRHLVCRLLLEKKKKTTKTMTCVK